MIHCISFLVQFLSQWAGIRNLNLWMNSPSLFSAVVEYQACGGVRRLPRAAFETDDIAQGKARPNSLCT